MRLAKKVDRYGSMMPELLLDVKRGDVIIPHGNTMVMMQHVIVLPRNI
jgi:hypothetical protein